MEKVEFVDISLNPRWLHIPPGALLLCFCFVFFLSFRFLYRSEDPAEMESHTSGGVEIIARDTHVKDMEERERERGRGSEGARGKEKKCFFLPNKGRWTQLYCEAPNTPKLVAGCTWLPVIKHHSGLVIGLFPNPHHCLAAPAPLSTPLFSPPLISMIRSFLTFSSFLSFCVPLF